MIKNITALVLLSSLCTGTILAEDSSYRIQAALTVAKAGLVEVTLPAALHSASGDGLDLRVLAPKDDTGKSDYPAHELYWRSEKKEEALTLKAESQKLLDNGRFLWTGKPAKEVKANLVRAYLAADDYVTRVNVWGLASGSWVLLTKDAAVYKSGGSTMADIPIPEGTYRSYRLEFNSFDTRYLRQAAPVDRIEIMSSGEGTDFRRESLVSVPVRTDTENGAQLSVTLPGSGLTIQDIRVSLSAPFIGEWRLEREVIQGGKRQFTLWKEGGTDSILEGSDLLLIPVGERASSRFLRLTLMSGPSIGKITKFETVLLLPRLVFRADKAGTFLVQGGCGEKTVVRNTANASGVESAQEALWSPVETNPEWKSENLVKKYALGGGPFDKAGYAWHAPVDIRKSGYYRVVLNRTASLGGNADALRVVRENTQIPYFFGQGETVEIKPDAVEIYDGTVNTTTWMISLSQSSPEWKNLTLEAEGAFSRNLVLEAQNSISLIWNKWQEVSWSSRESGTAKINIPLSALDENTVKIRLVIDNGDNKRLNLSRITASYFAPALCFLADASGGYEIMGGNPGAKAARYDLALIQDDLLVQETETARMAECIPLKGSNPLFPILRQFEGKKWVLYAVLALVTVALLLVIARLFPAIKEKKE